MSNTKSFTLFLYSTKILIITLLGSIFFGTMLLIESQFIWPIPIWVQYLILTIIIFTAFIISRYFATTPVIVQIDDQSITIKQREKTDCLILLEEISSYAYYEELTLYSLKISLHSNQIISIINYKWNDNTEFHSFFGKFELLLENKVTKNKKVTVLKAKTFYASRTKALITLFIFIIYSSIAIILFTRNAFGSWNPIYRYYFWFIPIMFFFKMLKAK